MTQLVLLGTIETLLYLIQNGQNMVGLLFGTLSKILLEVHLTISHWTGVDNFQKNIFYFLSDIRSWARFRDFEGRVESSRPDHERGRIGREG